MIRVESLMQQMHILTFSIEPGQVKGVFGRDLAETKDILLKIAGIHQNKKTCFYNDVDVYDNPSYFKERVYLDCTQEYIQTLKVETIAKTIKQRFNKEIDIEKMKQYIKNFGIRGECEITHRYTFTKNSQTLLNVALALSMEQHLLLFNPTKNIKRSKDILTIGEELKKREKTTILGLNCLGHFAGFLDEIILLGDRTTIYVNPKNNKFSVVDANELFEQTYIFKSKDQTRMIIPLLSKEHVKICQRHKIKHITIEPYDIENYW